MFNPASFRSPQATQRLSTRAFFAGLESELADDLDVDALSAEPDESDIAPYAALASMREW